MKNLQLFIDIYEKNSILVEHNCNQNVMVENISYNSREVTQNTLFFCKGAHFKEQFLCDALNKGAVAYVSEKKYDVDAQCILVSDIRKSLYLSANFFYDNAWDKLNLIGITGTKGKSTTAYYIKYILDEYLKANGEKESGLASTLEIYDGIVRKPSTLTTPEPFELHKHFDNAVKSQTDFFTMEVSSQALKYGRTEGVHFKIGCYLNIGIDHISAVEHPDFEDYFISKMKLFTQCDTAIINLDSDLSERVVEYSKSAKRVVTFSTKNPQADIYGYNIHKDNSETVFSVKTDTFENEFRLSMPGLFNVENALCAIGVAYVFGISPDYIFNGLYKSKTAGRMETYESEDKKIAVIVDYAHNKLSFETIISSMRKEYTDRPISILFGCPGNKALIRRKDMGEVSGKMADFIYVTEDDPAEERIEDICNEIAGHIENVGGTGKYKIIHDRETAIKTAIEDVKDTAVIILAGKGAETHQKRGLVSEDYASDAVLAKRYLKEYDERQGK
mgnify:FL=1